MDDEERAIDRLVRDVRTVAVVGLSADPARASHDVARYLQRAGLRIVPVNPRLEGRAVLGEPSYPSLRAVPDDVHIDVVDVFRRPEHVGAVVDDALARGGDAAIWMQLGIADEASAARARAAGRTVVMDRCLAVEHRLRSRRP